MAPRSRSSNYTSIQTKHPRTKARAGVFFRYGKLLFPFSGLVAQAPAGSFEQHGQHGGEGGGFAQGNGRPERQAAENEDGAIDLIGSKDNKDNKDNTNNIYNNKHFDPYFNNPVVDKFKKEYERIFNTTRCYLDAIQINKLTEISVDNPDFINKIPEILNKYSRIEFSNGINKFNLRGLINDGKWAAILNGEYDAYIRPEENNGEFDLGIPTCEVGK